MNVELSQLDRTYLSRIEALTDTLGDISFQEALHQYEIAARICAIVLAQTENDFFTAAAAQIDPEKKFGPWEEAYRDTSQTIASLLTEISGNLIHAAIEYRGGSKQNPQLIEISHKLNR